MKIIFSTQEEKDEAIVDAKTLTSEEAQAKLVSVFEGSIVEEKETGEGAE